VLSFGVLNSLKIVDSLIRLFVGAGDKPTQWLG